MKILAIETSTLVSSVALVTEERVLAELTTATRLAHSETLLPHIEQVMKMAGVERSELTAIAVSIGPGSFTGLRIGLATAKGLSYALQLPLVGVSTLAALAAGFPLEGSVVGAMLDAQKGNVYLELYRSTAAGQELIAPVEVLPLAEALARCGAVGSPVMVVGDIAAKKLRDKELPEKVYLAPPSHVLPRAAAVAELAKVRLEKGENDSVMDLAPTYIRRSEAEELWEKRQQQMVEQ